MPPLLRFRTFVFGREVDMHETVNAEIGSGVRRGEDQEAGDDDDLVIDELGRGERGEIQGREEAREREGDRDDGYKPDHEP